MPPRASDDIHGLMLCATCGAAASVTSADAVAGAVPAAGTSTVASSVASAIGWGGGAEERGTEAGGTAPACGCRALVVTVAAEAPAKDVGAGSGTNGVYTDNGNAHTIVASDGAGSGTRCGQWSSGGLARRPPSA